MAAPELIWIKSSRSGGTDISDCVEVALAPEVTAVRDSKAPAAGHLTVSHLAWRSFLTMHRC